MAIKLKFLICTMMLLIVQSTDTSLRQLVVCRDLYCISCSSITPSYCYTCKINYDARNGNCYYSPYSYTTGSYYYTTGSTTAIIVGVIIPVVVIFIIVIVICCVRKRRNAARIVQTQEVIQVIPDSNVPVVNNNIPYNNNVPVNYNYQNIKQQDGQSGQRYTNNYDPNFQPYNPAYQYNPQPQPNNTNIQLVDPSYPQYNPNFQPIYDPNNNIQPYNSSFQPINNNNFQPINQPANVNIQNNGNSPPIANFNAGGTYH
jgi:hypothetical protein